MDGGNKSIDESIRKRELVNARMRNYRKRKNTYKRSDTMPHDQSATDEKAEQQKEASRKRSKTYREKKRIDALKNIQNFSHDSQIPGPSHANPPFVTKNQISAFHDSQVVYEYDKIHSQQLVYVALSRATCIERLYIVTENSNQKFSHGRRECTSVVDLQNEFKRLSLNRLQTVTDVLTNFIYGRKGISIYSLNCQSLHAHALDLDDSVMQHLTILLLSETWINNEENINIPNFDCISKFKRHNHRAAGVAILKNNQDTANVTSDMSAAFPNSQSHGFHQSSIGDISIVRYEAEHGQIIVMVAIYISPNASIDKIIEFIHENLLVYTEAGSALLNRQLHKLPMILSGDFNIDFSKDKSKTLVAFLKDKFNLIMSNDPNHSTTKYGTTLDAVFFRYLNKFQSTVFITYFSYHKPIISFLEYTNKETHSEQNSNQ